jgi:hypothetical protein
LNKSLTFNILDENLTRQKRYKNIKALNKNRKRNNEISNKFNKISKKLSSNLLDLFSESEIEKIARESGFVSKQSKLSGFKFLDLLLFSRFDNEKLSLNDLSVQSAYKHNISISKQAINDRFTDKSVYFIKLIIEKFIKENIACEDEIEFLDHFERIRIKDSTCFQLPKSMKDKYAGSGGAASNAMVRIQFEYDYKTGEVIVLSVNEFNRQDRKDASESIDNIHKNDLVIRDLGYVVNSVLKEIDRREASFLNRLNTITQVFEKNKDDEFIQLDFVKLRNEMHTFGVSILDKTVYIGAVEKYKVRLVIEEMPQDKINERIRKIKKEAKKKKRTLRKETLARAALNLFVTNVHSEILPVSSVRSLYRLRWQIELMFKVWKSVGGISKIKKMKVERFETYLYARLLWLMINWRILWQIQLQLWKEKRILISFIKAHKTILDRMDRFRDIVINKKNDLTEFIMDIYLISPINHKLEKKKSKLSSMEIIKMFN